MSGSGPGGHGTHGGDDGFLGNCQKYDISCSCHCRQGGLISDDGPNVRRQGVDEDVLEKLGFWLTGLEGAHVLQEVHGGAVSQGGQSMQLRDLILRGALEVLDQGGLGLSIDVGGGRLHQTDHLLDCLAMQQRKHGSELGILSQRGIKPVKAARILNQAVGADSQKSGTLFPTSDVAELTRAA